MASEPKPEDPRKPEETFPGLGHVYRDLGPYLTLGIQLAAAIIFFFLIGRNMDTTHISNDVPHSVTNIFQFFHMKCLGPIDYGYRTNTQSRRPS